MISLQYTDGDGGSHTYTYAYSGDGFLAQINDLRIVRDGALALQERNPAGDILREYTWGLSLGGGIGGLLSLHVPQGDAHYNYLYDGKGNVEAILDNIQAVAAQYRYDPFGNLLAQSGTLEQPFGFSTKRYDAGTGLVYYGRRFYSPALGRWTTRDPLGEHGGLNLYAFVGNNPVNWMDPWGLQAGTTCEEFVESIIADRHTVVLKCKFYDIYDPAKLGKIFLDKRNTTLPNAEGFKLQLVDGGQGGAISRHIYGHAGVILYYGPLAGGIISYWEERRDYNDQFRPGRTVEESMAEIADDRAAREVADCLSHGPSGSDGISDEILRDMLQEILCQ